MNNIYTVIFLTLMFTACQPQASEEDQSPSTSTAPAAAPTSASTAADDSEVKELSDAEKVLHRTVTTHGGDHYGSANYSFVFRKKTYNFKNDGTNYRYTVTDEKDGSGTVDVLNNGKFTRTIGGTKITLSEKDIAKYSEALNSVIYFATLPHKLLDPAVQLSLLPPANIQGKAYYTLMVQFQEEGGGTDHDDNFRYWINQKTNRIDYLAYDYKTNEGGVRFRSAYNPRKIDGIIFQDYINYKAPLGTNLDDLTGMFDRGELKELSRIETEEVVKN